MNRHWPSADLSDTPVKARVAVSSLALASAADDGCKTPPARDTGTGSVGLVSGTEPTTAAVVAAVAMEVVVAAVSLFDAATAAALVAAEVEAASLVTVTKVVNPMQLDAAVVASVAGGSTACTALDSAATEIVEDVGSSEADEIDVDPEAELAGPIEALPPKTNDCVASPLQDASSITLLPVTVKQVPAWLDG